MNVRKEVNKVTGANEAFIPGVLKSLPTELRENTNGKKWGIGLVDVTNPQTGETEEVRAMIYEGQINAVNPDTGEQLFKPGTPVDLATQVDGQYAGNARIQLRSGGGISESLAAAFNVKLEKSVAAPIEADA